MMLVKRNISWKKFGNVWIKTIVSLFQQILKNISFWAEQSPEKSKLKISIGYFF